MAIQGNPPLRKTPLTGVILRHPFEVITELVRAVQAGEIELEGLQLDTTAATSNRLTFTFRGTARMTAAGVKANMDRMQDGPRDPFSMNPL